MYALQVCITGTEDSSYFKMPLSKKMNTCYYHKEFENKEVAVSDNLNPFCNEREHKLWAEKIYGSTRKMGIRRDITYMQEKLLEFGKKATVKINETKPIFTEEDFRIPETVNLDH